MGSLRTKVVFIGDTGVGKTSIIRSYRHQSIITEPTVAVKPVTVSLANRAAELAIWDTPGRTLYECVLPIYIRGAVIVVVVFDVTNPATFQNVGNWISTATAVQEDCHIFLVGNKTDLEGPQVALTDIEDSYSDAAIGLRALTSAQTGHGIDVLFESIADAAEKHNVCDVIPSGPLLSEPALAAPPPQPCQC
jgi:small GTP-binding protein